MKRLIVLATGLCAATVGVVGCADGPDVTAGSSQASEEFCAAATAVDSFMPGPPEDKASHEEFERLLDEMAESAPARLRSDVEAVHETVLAFVEDPQETMSHGGMTRDDLDAMDRIDEALLAGCAISQRIEITATDHEFIGTPENIRAGRVALTFHNEGHEEHMVQFVAVRHDGGISTEKLLQLPDEEASKYLYGPAAFASAGLSDTVFIELVPGRHFAADPLPIGGSSFGVPGWGEPHYTRGMWAESPAPLPRPRTSDRRSEPFGCVGGLRGSQEVPIGETGGRRD